MVLQAGIFLYFAIGFLHGEGPKIQKSICFCILYVLYASALFIYFFFK